VPKNIDANNKRTLIKQANFVKDEILYSIVPVKHIVYYREGAIGDVMHCLPAIRLHKELVGDIYIELVVGTKQLQSLISQCCPFIDKVSLKSEMQKTQVAEFIYLHSNFLKAISYNFKFFRAKEFFVYRKNNSFSAVCNYVLTRFPQFKKDLKQNPFAVLKYHNLLLPKNPNPSNPYICIVPGVGALRPLRAYPLEKWFELISKILETTNYQIKILGGPDEAELSKIIDGKLQNPRIENLIGKTSLLELASVINDCKHLYSADTGILHIAAALDTKVTSYFSVTKASRFGPFHPRAFATTEELTFASF